VANDLHYANGLALSNDGKTLFLAESEAGRVIQFNVQPDGSLGDRRLFVRVGQVDSGSGSSAYPDGLKIDSKGNLHRPIQQGQGGGGCSRQAADQNH
jgi:sugar lactone lactonase YvrE